MNLIWYNQSKVYDWYKYDHGARIEYNWINDVLGLSKKETVNVVRYPNLDEEDLARIDAEIKEKWGDL